jgi:hypothetical protein
MLRSRTTALLTLAAMAAAVLAGLSQLAPAQPGEAPGRAGKPAPTTPLVQWAGSTSKHEPGFFLIQDDPAWQKLWAKHTGQPADLAFTQARHLAPKIDFGRCLVVAYFRGRAVNQDGEIATSVQDLPDQVLIRFEPSSFQTSGEGPRGGAQDTTPFGLWLIPVTQKPIVIQEIRRELKDQPQTLHEVKRFPARYPPPSACAG